MIKKQSIKGYPDLDISIFEASHDIKKINRWFDECLANINWIEGIIKIFGKNIIFLDFKLGMLTKILIINTLARLY